LNLFATLTGGAQPPSVDDVRVISAGESADGTISDGNALQVTGDGGAIDPVVVPVAASDFNGDGRVDFIDYLNFAKHFGTNSSDADFDPQIDLDQNGIVGFADFVLFVQSFGKDVEG